MTLFEFRLLSRPEQVSILYQQGVYIGKRRQGQQTMLMYQVDSFYVEVVYRMYRKYIDLIRCSESTEMLDPYLEQISVEYVVS